MTDTDGMDLFDRLVTLGFVVPPEEIPGAVFTEWFRHVKALTVADLTIAIDRLAASRADRFWPLPGELRAYLPHRVEDPLRESCPTCHGALWVESTPVTANGGIVYETVKRCPDCGVPPPRPDPYAARQTPLTVAEQAARTANQRPVEILRTKDEFLARVRQICAGKGWTSVAAVAQDLERRLPREPGDDD